MNPMVKMQENTKSVLTKVANSIPWRDFIILLLFWWIADFMGQNQAKSQPLCLDIG
jgi:hypothetical protein